MNETLMTQRELAAMLRLSINAVSARVASGEFPCHRIGRAVRFTASDVTAILNSTASGAKPTREKRTGGPRKAGDYPVYTPPNERTDDADTAGKDTG